MILEDVVNGEYETLQDRENQISFASLCLSALKKKKKLRQKNHKI